ncbi:MAG: hypothetical protein KDB36_04210 [Acidimicrobiales bacterium]|nr:hypothetical protein [Acidimicrobiales bacterium]
MIRPARAGVLLAACALVAVACGGTPEASPDTDAGSAPMTAATSTAGTAAPTSSAAATSAPATSAPPTTAASLVPLPEPPYAVGKATLTFKDPSRETEANGGVPASPGRTMPVAIFYPAPGAADGTVRDNTSILRDRTWPLLVFVHGTSMTGERYEALTSAMASAGYVVVAPTLPGTSATAAGGPNPALYGGQPADVSFVISAMLDLNGRPEGPLAGRLDPEAIGVFGQSTGGDVALALTHDCCRDARVRAVAALAGTQYLRPGVPNFPIDGYFASPSLPMLLIHGDADEITPYGDSSMAFDQAAAPKFRATMLGADHLGPSGAAGPSASFDASVALLEAFFAAYVSGPTPPAAEEVAAILAAGDVPGVSRLDSAVE